MVTETLPLAATQSAMLDNLIASEGGIVLDGSHSSILDLDNEIIRLAEWFGRETEAAPEECDQGLAYEEWMSFESFDSVEWLNDNQSRDSRIHWFIDDNSLFVEMNHQHYYRDDIADWWCVECENVADNCEQD